jgi:alpha-ketoglutarate-dependent taurine dioxygenase
MGGQPATEVSARDTDLDFPLLIEAPERDMNFAAWLESELDSVRSQLTSHGAILFRGFDTRSPTNFQRGCQAFGSELLPYTERTAPRVELVQGVYTSTVHPSDQYIQFHNANSYSHRWPRFLWFGCMQPASSGGRTPISDCRKVYRSVDEAVRRKFEETGVRYLRNFRKQIGLSWQTTFQTEDPEEVRAYCKQADIEVDLFEGDRLRTWQTRRAVVKHPETGIPVWFNQAHLFHIGGLEPKLRRVLTKSYGESDLPRNAFYGDGSTIPDEVSDHIIECYREAEASFDWQVGDFMMLDNMATAHSRTPYEGERLVVVSFADVYDPEADEGQGT